MKTEQFILSFNAVLFILFGVISLISPVLVSSLISFELQTPAASIEFLATYGGLFLGIGLFMPYCIKTNLRLGLVCVLFTMGSMLFSRVSGALIFGGVDLIQSIYIGGELFTALLVSFLLYNSRIVQSHN